MLLDVTTDNRRVTAFLLAISSSTSITILFSSSPVASLYLSIPLLLRLGLKMMLDLFAARMMKKLMDLAALFIDLLLMILLSVGVISAKLLLYSSISSSDGCLFHSILLTLLVFLPSSLTK